MNNTTLKKPTPLSKDLSVIVRDVTSRNNIAADSLCADGQINNAITLEDNQPVLFDITTDQFLGFFDNSSGHFFPTPVHMARLGYVAGLTVYEIIALMLKSVYEMELHQKFNFLELSSMLENDEICSTHASKFTPDKKHLFRILELMKMPFAEAESYELFCFAVDEIVEHKIYFLSYSEVENIFGKEKREEIRQLSEHTERNLSTQYIIEKKRFMQQEAYVSDLMYGILEAKNYNKNLQNEYYKRFGSYLLRYREYFIFCEVMEQKLKLKTEHPELSEQEIEEKVESFLESRAAEIRTMRNEISQSLRVLPEILLDNRREGNPQQYEQEVKQVVADLTRLLHPDLLSDEEQSKLTPRHNEELGNLWDQLLNIKKSFNYSSRHIGYYFPPLSELTQIKLNVLKIFKNAGIQRGDTIHGANLEEKLAYLRKTISLLAKRAIELELEKSVHLNCEQTKMYLSVMKSSDSIQKHIAELKNKVYEYKQKHTTLQEKYKQLFNNYRNNM